MRLLQITAASLRNALAVACDGLGHKRGTKPHILSGEEDGLWRATFPRGIAEITIRKGQSTICRST